MSARVAWNGTGLVGALRSMNVSREDPEPWTLEALICSTRTPRTCAVSAPSAVAPARGICDSGRPARSPLSVSLAGRTRKPLPRPSGVSMPCAPGWPVWSVARQGGEGPNRPACAVPHRTPECKGNYASFVKEIMPLELESHLAKSRSLLPKLALIFHLAADGREEEIPLVQAQRAVNFCAYLEAHARRVYGCVASMPLRLAATLGQQLRRGSLGNGFGVGDVYLQGWAGLDTAERARVAIGVLVDAGWVRPSSVPGGRRESEEYMINPAIFSD